MNINMLLDVGFIAIMTALSIIPIMILCFNQTLRQDMKSGAAVALGAALAQLAVVLAQTFFGVVAIFYLADIFIASLGIRRIIQIIGACILLYLGLKEFWIKVRDGQQPKKTRRWLTVLLIFLLTLMTTQFEITPYFALFPNEGAAKPGSLLLSISVMFLGLIGGWMLIVLITGTIKYFLSSKWQDYVRYGGGFSLAAYALWLLLGPWIYVMFYK